MLLGKICYTGESVFVITDREGTLVQRSGTITEVRACSGNGQIITVEIGQGETVETLNRNDHIDWSRRQ